MQNLRVERHSAVKNAENDQSLTASFSVFFELLSLRKISIICLFRCGSLVPVVAWLARKRLLSIVDGCHLPGILGLNGFVISRMDENFVKGKTDRKYSALYCHIPDVS